MLAIVIVVSIAMIALQPWIVVIATIAIAMAILMVNNREREPFQAIVASN